MNSVKSFSIHKKNNWLIKFSIGIVALLILLFILNVFVSPIRNGFYAMSSPLQKTFWVAGVSSSNFLGSFLNAGNLASQNQDLKNQNQKLLAEVASLQSITQGNQAQTAVSAACQNNGFTLAMAGVIGLDDNDVLSINKGSADGIAEGMPVISQQNALFGKVFKVYKNYSEVMLISNKTSVVNVKVQQSDSTASEIDGAVKGSGGLAGFLDLIPINSAINPQDILVTSAIDKIFPKDLLVGTIIQKTKNDQKPFQSASVDLFMNVKTADNLFVITNYKQ